MDASGAPQSPDRRSNRKLVGSLLAIVAASSALGWALIPLYGAFSRITGVGNSQVHEGPRSVHDRVDASRVVTVELMGYPGSVGTFDFRPAVAEMRVHPGRVYEARFLARNLTSMRQIARAVPSLQPENAFSYVHRTACFCFRLQEFAAGAARSLPISFVIDPSLPVNIDRISMSYALFDANQSSGRG